MKRFLHYFILSFFFSTNVIAQTYVRKVPFLPYTGADSNFSDSSSTEFNNTTKTSQPFSKQPVTKTYETIFFNDNSADIRADQQNKIIQIGKRLEHAGQFYTVVGFRTNQISRDLCLQRLETVVQSLGDFHVGDALYQIEFRKHPVINPNRVEVYFK